MGTFCCYWQKVTRRRQQKREVSWTAESYLHKYSPSLRSQCSHRLWRSVPHGRASGFFNCPRSGSVSEIRQFPTSAGFRMQLLHTKKEVLKPSVSSGIFRKPSKRRLWRMKRGGFEEVSRFSCHNVVGNRLTRRCRQSADWLWESVFPGGKRNIFFA